MSKFEQYNIVLKDLTERVSVREYMLDDVFFKKIDSPEVQKGEVKATVTIRKADNIFGLSFNLSGTIIIPCDRCLDDMEQPISHKEDLQVKFGNKLSEEGEIVIVPEAEGAINIAWFLYEFIILNIPIKHVHPQGFCNKAMMSKLKKHIRYSGDDEEDKNDKLRALLEMDDEEGGESSFVTDDETI